MNSKSHNDIIALLSKKLAKLPGMGQRSARRVLLHLLEDKEKNLIPLIDILVEAQNDVKKCSQCGNLDACDPCMICADEHRDNGVICLVQSVGDIWAMERTRSFKGRYHVLGGVLSALDGIGPDDLAIDTLIVRLEKVTEIVIALGATVDGQATAHFVAQKIRDQVSEIKLSRLAYGVPIGGEVEYLDDSTLATALQSRTAFL